MPDPTSLPALAPIATVVVLLEVAAGTTVAAYAVDLVGKVGRGFVGTTSLICGGLMALDLLIEALLPSGTSLLGAALPADAQASLFHWSIAFTIALLGYAFFCAVMTDAARRVVELGWCETGQRVGITAGLPSGRPGTTSLVQIQVLG